MRLSYDEGGCPDCGLSWDMCDCEPEREPLTAPNILFEIGEEPWEE